MFAAFVSYQPTLFVRLPQSDGNHATNALSPVMGLPGSRISLRFFRSVPSRFQFCDPHCKCCICFGGFPDRWKQGLYFTCFTFTTYYTFSTSAFHHRVRCRHLCVDCDGRIRLVLQIGFRRNSLNCQINDTVWKWSKTCDCPSILD